jgi:hypothetical protein
LNLVLTPEEGRSGSDLVGSPRGRGHSRTAHAPLKPHGVGAPEGRTPPEG